MCQSKQEIIGPEHRLQWGAFRLQLEKLVKDCRAGHCCSGCSKRRGQEYFRWCSRGVQYTHSPGFSLISLVTLPRPLHIIDSLFCNVFLKTKFCNTIHKKSNIPIWSIQLVGFDKCLHIYVTTILIEVIKHISSPPNSLLPLRNQYPSPTSRLSLMNKDVEHCFVYILVIIFFCEIFVQILCPLLLQLFVFLLLSCKGSLCILDISPLNFSCCGLPFFLFLATFFKEQKFKISIKSDLSIFYLMVLLFVYNLRSLCLAQ